MKRQRNNLSLPAIKKFREAIGGNDLGGFLINQCERCGAGSCRVKFKLKNKPFVVTIEARRVR